MRRLRLDAIAVAAGMAMFAATPVLAGAEGKAPVAPAHAEMTDDGPVLVTPAGMTLYTYAPDDGTPGKPQCKSVPVKTYQDVMGGLGDNALLLGADARKSCTEKFPPYFMDESAQPNGDFGIMNRPEGGKQWTYRGHPLYLSLRDKKPGDRYGADFQFGGVGRGWRFAAPPLDLPAGLKLARLEENLVLATENGRPVYTPHGVRTSKACAGCGDELFEPILAGAMANVSGGWSMINAGVGRKQYAFKGKPLYAAPVGMADYEIAEAGGWEPVVFRKGSGRPPEIETHFSLLGDVYTDKAGRTLYTFNCTTPARDGVSCDDPGDPAGYVVALCGSGQECAERWRPYLASPDARPAGQWSVADVPCPLFTDPHGFTFPPDAPRVKAWAYRGKPVYTYYDDKEPGDIWGHKVYWVRFSSFDALQVPGRSED